MLEVVFALFPPRIEGVAGVAQFLKQRPWVYPTPTRPPTSATAISR